MSAGALIRQEESFEIYRDPPRLFLTAQRLRRLRRDRDRRVARWEQFEALVRGSARLPEPGFALALYAQVAGDEEAARKAVAWAATAADARQIALVYDWCQPHSESLKPRLEQARLKSADPAARALAAVALGDAAGVAAAVRDWWRKEVAPGLNSGASAMSRRNLYGVCELMHAVRDNTGIELRDDVPGYFRGLPHLLLASYYPAAFAGPEGEYRVPASKGAPAIEVAVAALSRAAELALVAYDTNLEENQYLQGWAMHDRFMLRDAFGAPYEFLWANPYQPGLSYHHLPPVAYDARAGRLFARSSWEDGSDWLGWFERELQTFADGRPRVVPLREARGLYRFGDVTVIPAPRPGRFQIATEAKAVYVIGLDPGRTYRLQPDGRAGEDAQADRGGIIRLEFAPGFRGRLNVALGRG